MALSPWPSTPVALATATATLRAEIDKAEDQGGKTDAQIQRLGAVAAGMTERYAPAAPQAIKDESVVRFSAYLLQRPQSVTQISVSNVEITFNNNHAAMFRHCGAAALLSLWKARRAGPVG